MIENKYRDFLKLSYQYLTTSKLIMEEIVKKENTNFLIHDGPHNSTSRKAFMEEIKWSDFNTLIPAIFLFTHGLELTLKGLLKFQKKTTTNSHDLVELLKRIDEKTIEKKIVTLLKKYIDLNRRTIISEFIKTNKNTNNIINFLLRYPDFAELNIDYTKLRYRGKKILGKLNTMIRDIESIKKIICNM